MDMKRHIGMRVKAARAKLKLSQEQLGGLIGKLPESVSNIERGHVLPPLDTLQQLAQHLDVPMTYFFEDMDQTRHVARNRVELELKLRALGEELTDNELKLVVAVAETVKGQRVGS